MYSEAGSHRPCPLGSSRWQLASHKPRLGLSFLGSLRGPRARERDGKVRPAHTARGPPANPARALPGRDRPARHPRAAQAPPSPAAGPARAPPEPRPRREGACAAAGWAHAQGALRAPARRPVERDAAVARLARVPCAAAGGGAVTRHLGQRRALGFGGRRGPGRRPDPAAAVWRVSPARPRRVPPQPALPTAVCGTHGLAIAAPPRSREVCRAAEVGTIETRKRAALAAGRTPEAAGGAAGLAQAARIGLVPAVRGLPWAGGGSSAALPGRAGSRGAHDAGPDPQTRSGPLPAPRSSLTRRV